MRCCAWELEMMTALGTGGRQREDEWGGGGGGGGGGNHYTSAYHGIPCSPDKCPGFSSFRGC